MEGHEFEASAWQDSEFPFEKEGSEKASRRAILQLQLEVRSKREAANRSRCIRQGLGAVTHPASGAPGGFRASQPAAPPRSAAHLRSITGQPGRQPARPRPKCRDTWDRATAPHAGRRAGCERGERARRRRPFLIGLLGCQSPLAGRGGRAGTSGLGGAKGRGRGLAEEEAGQAGRRLSGANHGQPGQEGGGVRQRHWGKSRRGGRVDVRGARGPSAAGLRSGGAGRRAGGLSGGRRRGRGRSGGSRGRGPALSRWPGARLPLVQPKAARPFPTRPRASACAPRPESRDPVWVWVAVGPVPGCREGLHFRASSVFHTRPSGLPLPV